MGEPLDIKITLPPESAAMLRKLEAMPKEVPQAVKRGMDRALQIISGKIAEKRLSGRGPFPVSQHRLGERSGSGGHLRRSVRAEPAVIRGTEVTGAIGSNVFYAAVHEYGMTITGKPLMRFRIGEKTIVTGRVVIPERAPFRTEILGSVKVISDEVASELEKIGGKNMNVFSQLQQSIIGRLTVIDTTVPSLEPAAGEIKWITEDIGDLANIINRTVGSLGLIGIVLTPGGGKLFEVGIFPISFLCPVEIQLQENVTVNRGNGTKIPALDLVQFCMRRLHLWSPTNQRINKIELDETPYLMVSEYPVLTYNVRFNAKLTIQ